MLALGKTVGNMWYCQVKFSKTSYRKQNHIMMLTYGKTRQQPNSKKPQPLTTIKYYRQTSNRLPYDFIGSRPYKGITYLYNQFNLRNIPIFCPVVVIGFI